MSLEHYLLLETGNSLKTLLVKYIIVYFSRWQAAYVRPRRKDKDGFSTFSNDSGNVNDFTEGSEHKMVMVKSKSMPEYAEDRFIRGSASRRYFSSFNN